MCSWREHICGVVLVGEVRWGGGGGRRRQGRAAAVYIHTHTNSKLVAHDD